MNDISKPAVARMAPRTRKRAHPAPPPGEQSGSTGRDPGRADHKGPDTGQGKYGQSGFGGGRYDKGSATQHERAKPGRNDPDAHDSNEGSGRADRDESQRGK